MYIGCLITDIQENMPYLKKYKKVS